VHQALHSLPSFLYAGIGELDVSLFLGVCPPRRVTGFNRYIFQGYREVHDVEVKVVNAPVCELLAADGLDFVAFVEGVPELGDEEEVFALHEALFDGAGDAFAGFFFVAVVLGRVS
jgi:hypothetical protein